MTIKSILLVVTSHDKMGNLDRKTGFWLEEVTTPFYAFLDAGHIVTIASPKGGNAPIDPKSAEREWQTDSTGRFYADDEAQEIFRETERLTNIDPAWFDGLFIPGGHGPMWDYPTNGDLKSLTETFDRTGRPIGVICHGPAALVSPVKENGEPLVKGRRVTSFTNTEEQTVGLADIVPFLLETRLRELGGDFVKGNDFAPHVVSDGLLITGQNPASSAPAAK